MRSALRIFFAAVAGAALAGCASTSIETELGRYYSTKDQDIRAFEIDITKPDGTRIIVKLGSTRADASAVNIATMETMQKLIDRIP